MAVRVRIEIEGLVGSSKGKKTRAVALVNSGYEAESGECSIPVPLARQLGLWPAPEGAEQHVVRGYGGPVNVNRVPDVVRVRVVTDDREGPVAVSAVLLAEADDEVIISDALSEMLGIVILKPKKGLWVFSDEPADKERGSLPAQFWSQ